MRARGDEPRNTAASRSRKRQRDSPPDPPEATSSADTLTLGQ